MLVMLNMFYIIIRSERNQKRFWFIRQGRLFNGGLTQSINGNINDNITYELCIIYSIQKSGVSKIILVWNNYFIHHWLYWSNDTFNIMLQFIFHTNAVIIILNIIFINESWKIIYFVFHNRFQHYN